MITVETISKTDAKPANNLSSIHHLVKISQICLLKVQGTKKRRRMVGNRPIISSLRDVRAGKVVGQPVFNHLCLHIESSNLNLTSLTKKKRLTRSLKARTISGAKTWPAMKTTTNVKK